MSRSAGETSDRSAAAARRPRPGFRASRTCSTSAWWAAASGRPPTPAGGRARFPTSSRRARSVRSTSRSRIRTSSTWERARDCTAPISRRATACTSRRTPARRGRISDCATHSRFRASRSIQRILNACSLRRSAIRTGRIPNAEFSARPTAGRLSRKCCSRMTTPAEQTSCSRRTTRTPCTPRSGRPSTGRGRTAPSAARTGDSSRASMARFYHVAADNAFRYRLCSGQQDSGLGCVSSRGNDGTIGYREFHPVGVDEYGYAAPDPLNPDLVYGGASVTRFNRLTGQVQPVGPSAGAGRGGGGGGPDTLFRHVRTAPVLFSSTNPHKLYLGTNRVWQTTDAGAHWKSISPDLSRETWAVPKNVGQYAGTPAAAVTRRGVIYTLAPSPVDSNTLWAGTDDGLIQVTRDGGKSWKNVTPPEIGPWAKVSIMDASHSDANVAYAAINTFHLDDLRPHIFRTRDGGKTWKEIVTSIDSGATINVVREDTKRKGLLFAGSETQVWFSLDDGDHWHSLRLNMPATSIRDLIIKDEDVAVGTHGRGFVILDDISALRQWSEAAAGSDVTLFKPATATRVRYSMYTDTPVPPDEPYAENPPDGAVIDYYLKRDAAGSVTLEISTSTGLPVREFSSADRVDPVKDVGNWPSYWFRPTQVLSTKAGLQRYVWDLHFEAPAGECSLPISATPHNTKCEPEGIWAQPGKYTAKLTVDGKSYAQSFTVRMDPRVKTPAAALQQQYTLSLALYDAAREIPSDFVILRDLRRELADRRSKAPALSERIDALDKKISDLAGPDAASGRGGRGGQGGGGRGGAPAPDSYRSIAGELANAMNLLQGGDDAATSVVVGAARDKVREFAALNARLKMILGTEVPAINVALRAAGLQQVRQGPGPGTM